jgi:sulfotransferase family protein/aspartyl/asparaginyl beta-hydroxylase
MKLAKPFYRLRVRFDAQRLREEISALPASAWAKHPNDIRGNHSLRLISVDGLENDDVDGAMLPTPHLERLPYVRQVLASFGVVWSRSRLLKLEPFSGVPQHADINYHWFNRVRLHVPIVTHPDVRFFCGNENVHMAEGEAWIFDNWRLHRVENPVDVERIHLVADTSGTSSFWKLVEQDGASSTVHEHRYDAARVAQPLTERTALRPVMAPAEIDLLLLDLQSELAAPPAAASQEHLVRYCDLLQAFRRDWRQLYQLFGESRAGWAEYTKLRDSLRLVSKEQSERLTMRTNRVPAHMVLEGRVLRAVLALPAERGLRPVADRARKTHLERPIFIVAAPRSGSTLLFETLAASPEICTLGGEAHWLVEGIPQLRPGAPGVASNRLGQEHADEDVSERVVNQIVAQLKDNQGRPLPPGTHLRFLEKTPKNALRVPFFNRIFPDAAFIFLWRDPRENLSSIMEAWRSGKWKTYNGLEHFDGPWSLILPPGWPEMRGKSLEEIAAFQWSTTNEILLNDLEALPRERWIAVNYSDLIAEPAAAIERLCKFTGIAFSGPLAERAASPLPLSRFTQTPPAPGKWRRNEAAIVRVMPSIRATWQRMQDIK